MTACLITEASIVKGDGVTEPFVGDGMGIPLERIVYRLSTLARRFLGLADPVAGITQVCIEAIAHLESGMPLQRIMQENQQGRSRCERPSR